MFIWTGSTPLFSRELYSFSDLSRDFFGIPLVSKITCFSVKRSPLGAEGQKILCLILVHCWKRHLRHFPVILSWSRFLFFRFFFFGARVWVLILHLWYQNPNGYVAVAILIDCIISLSPFLDVIRISMSTVSFLAQLDSGTLCL